MIEAVEIEAVEIEANEIAVYSLCPLIITCHLQVPRNQSESYPNHL